MLRFYSDTVRAYPHGPGTCGVPMGVGVFRRGLGGSRPSMVAMRRFERDARGALSASAMADTHREMEREADRLNELNARRRRERAGD